MHVKIKICGITRFEDARIAASLGVDALGFIFSPGSPRYIEPSAVREIIRHLPPFCSKVGVFVDTPVAAIIDIARLSGIDTVQLHGAEVPEACAKIPFPVIKAFSVHPEIDINSFERYNVSGYLLDTWDQKSKGGTGKTFDWSIAERAARKYKSLILAGGLGPTNIKEALDQVVPYGIDVNSGVEIKPGVKNPQKMHDVIELVKHWH
jgi:phosphoribosylanthranilate isomerase